MITAVDSSVLLDVFLPDPSFGARSALALEEAELAGSLVICEPVYAELAAGFASQELLDEVLDELRIQVVPLGRSAAFHAGRAWKAYRSAGGRRERIINDFLIGAHALSNCSRLLTRDRGFYRTYFKALRVTDPSA